jgi:hypothetical protein
MRSLTLPLVAAAILSASVMARAGVPRTDCFPVERVRPDLRQTAEEILLDAADSSALYTLIGALKPMTSSFARSLGRLSPTGRGGALVFAKTELRADSPALRRVDELRQAMVALQCGSDIASAVFLDSGDYFVGDSNSSAEPFIFNLLAIQRVIARHADYLASMGVTPHASPEILLFSLKQLYATRPRDGEAAKLWYRQNAAPSIESDRIYGELYGYSQSAVDAYARGAHKVAAGEAPPDTNPRPVEAPVMKIPTFSGDDFRYRLAVAGHENEDDRILRLQAERILAEYRKRRERYVGPRKPGIVSLLRDWFCTGNTGCTASNATYPAPTASTK